VQDGGGGKVLVAARLVGRQRRRRISSCCCFAPARRGDGKRGRWCGVAVPMMATPGEIPERKGLEASTLAARLAGS
jgi:hypothetical protein